MQKELAKSVPFSSSSVLASHAWHFPVESPTPDRQLMAFLKTVSLSYGGAFCACEMTGLKRGSSSPFGWCKRALRRSRVCVVEDEWFWADTFVNAGSVPKWCPRTGHFEAIWSKGLYDGRS